MPLSRSTRCVCLVALGVAGCMPALVDERPGIIRHETPDQIRAKFHGPSVSIRALSGRNGIEPAVSVNDTAYVLIGTITRNGLLQIIYPARPSDTVRIAKDRRFNGPGVWGGYGTGGYFFAIASATPLRVDRISEDGHWSKFDVMYENTRWDPSHAITDLATAVATDIGQISIAHAVFGYSDNRRRMNDLRDQMDDRRRRWPPR